MRNSSSNSTTHQAAATATTAANPWGAGQQPHHLQAFASLVLLVACASASLMLTHIAPRSLQATSSLHEQPRICHALTSTGGIDRLAKIACSKVLARSGLAQPPTRSAVLAAPCGMAPPAAADAGGQPTYLQDHQVGRQVDAHRQGGCGAQHLHMHPMRVTLQGCIHPACGSVGS